MKNYVILFSVFSASLKWNMKWCQVWIWVKFSVASTNLHCSPNLSSIHPSFRINSQLNCTTLYSCVHSVMFHSIHWKTRPNCIVFIDKINDWETHTQKYHYHRISLIIQYGVSILTSFAVYSVQFELEFYCYCVSIEQRSVGRNSLDSAVCIHCSNSIFAISKTCLNFLRIVQAE